MKHEDKSDRLINIEILEHFYGKLGSDKDIERAFQRGRFDYCNSWADIGPLIAKHNIKLDPRRVSPKIGWTAFNQYNRELQSGDAAEYGCVYSNKFYSAFAKKTKSGMCSVLVWSENETNS